MRKELEKVKKQLCMTRYATKELEVLENELRELETESYIMGQQLTGMPTGTKRKDKVADRAIRAERLKERIKVSIAKIYEERERAEEILDLLEDADMRLVLRLHCINGMTWEQIIWEMNISESTAIRIYKKGLEEIYKKERKEQGFLR